LESTICGLTFNPAFNLVEVGEFGDSIQNFDGKSGTGFKFSLNDQKPFEKALQKTFLYFADQVIWEPLINNGMAMDFG
tara:strand:+ start:101 stop:334 length:234 start_codon:yes stop_codon:yes gene_type:complete